MTTAPRATDVDVRVNISPAYSTQRCADGMYAEFENRILTGEAPYTGRCFFRSNARLKPFEDLLPKGHDWTIVRGYLSGLVKPQEVVLAVDGRISLLFERTDEYCVEVQLCAPTREEVKPMMEEIKGFIPEIKVADHIVDTNVWSLSSDGPTRRLKKITAQSWDEIKDNYTPGVKEALNSMMEYQRPDGQGKIVLWHGPPGVGKTTVLRTLAREWKAWCSFHYISDPERFFAEPGYLMEVGTTEESEVIPPPSEHAEADDQPDPNEEVRSASWRLVVCEDSGEFLKARSRGDANAAMSRLLNFSDGILGQGSNTLFLITTNETIDKLDKAVTRPGRCLSQIEFHEFEANEARQWLLQRGGSKNYHGPVSLAQMMCDLDGTDRVVTGMAEPEAVGQYI